MADSNPTSENEKWLRGIATGSGYNPGDQFQRKMGACADEIKTLSLKLDAQRKLTQDYYTELRRLEDKSNASIVKLAGIRDIVDTALNSETPLPCQDEIALQTIWSECFAESPK